MLWIFQRQAERNCRNSAETQVKYFKVRSPWGVHSIRKILKVEKFFQQSLLNEFLQNFSFNLLTSTKAVEN